MRSSSKTRSMRIHATRIVVCLLACIAPEAAAHAQTPPVISATTTVEGSKADEALLRLITDNPLSLNNSVEFYQALLLVITREASSFPIGSSSGGFTYAFDPNLGLPVRRTRSFGPMFADRPLTSGRHKLSVSLSLQQTSWRALGGVDLKRGLTASDAYLASETASGRPESDYSLTRITFRTTRQVLNVTYGFSDRIDIGLIVPYGQALVSGDTTYTRTDMTTGEQVGGFEHAYSGTSSGLGDGDARIKIEFLRRPSVDLALGLDWKGRPPGGRRANHILGTAVTQGRAALIGAFPHGDVAPHFSVGYTLVPWWYRGLTLNGQTGGIVTESNEVNYTVGLDAALTGSVTVSGDVIGRTLLHSYTFGPRVGPFASEIVMNRGRVNVLLGAAGAKVLVKGNWLLNLSVAFPLNTAVLRPGITPVIGIERTF